MGFAAAAVGIGEPGGNQPARQVTCGICVKENMERLGRAAADGIFAGHIHASDLPSLTRGHHEIVSGKAVKGVARSRFEVLRGDATRRGCRVIHLIVKDVSGWYNRRYGRNTIGRGWSSADI